MGIDIMSTKSETLLFIRDFVKKSFVEDMIVIRVGEFTKEKTVLFHIIAEQFHGDKIVVRNSFHIEDGMVESDNKKYKSVFDIKSDDKKAVISAITEVINSYVDGEVTDEKLEQIKDEQVLIQRQSTDVAISGVIYTRDIIFDRPYYMVNYCDDGTNRTITGGVGDKNMWIARNVSREFLSEKFYKLIDAIREIEKIYDEREVLTVEFSIDNNDCIIIYQVSVVDTCIGNKKSITDHEFMDTKAFAKCNYLDNNQILSEHAYFSLSDIIGSNPRPLDYTLLRVLITSKIWNESLVKLGYSNVDDEIMVKVGNKPYISVNNTYRCLIPGGLDNSLKDKLLIFFEDKIKEEGKGDVAIENGNTFGIYNCTTDSKIERLKDNGFTDEECKKIAKELLGVTKNIICDYDRILEEEDRALEELVSLRHEIRANSPLTETNSMKLYGYITKLFELIKKNISPQYTRHSRSYAIAKSILLSMVEKGYFSYEQVLSYVRSIPNVMSDFVVDYDKYCMGKLPLDEFLAKYGHLRVEIFNLRTECYKKVYTEDFTKKPILKNGDNLSIGSRTSEINRIDADTVQSALDKASFGIDAECFLHFVEATIQNKEKYVFEFTKSLGLMLDIIIRLGETLGIAREDMSYLEIQDLLSYHSRDTYIQMISERRNMYYANTNLILPGTIYGVGDIDVISTKKSMPYFVTDEVVEADVVNLDEDKNVDVSGKIVVLSNGGSGYDWLFTKNIAGLIIKNGQENSYVVKRCQEFNTPAAIGCGERIFTEVSRMARVRFDCCKGSIKEI